MCIKTNEVCKFASSAVGTYVYCLVGHSYGLLLTLCYDYTENRQKYYSEVCYCECGIAYTYISRPQSAVNYIR
jgi:hypothetical protein